MAGQKFGHIVTKETRKKISEALRNEKHFNWKEKPTYGIVHYWLRQNYDQTNTCEHCRQQKRCQWALIKGKEYERKRENFIRLCVKCHRRYDFGERLRITPKCVDCGKKLKDWYAKRCYIHAQRERYRKEKEQYADKNI